MKNVVVKMLGMLGLLSVLLVVADNQFAGAPSEAAQSADRSATQPAPASMAGSGYMPGDFSEYLFLHQARLENIPVHSMAGVTTCPE